MLRTNQACNSQRGYINAHAPLCCNEAPQTAHVTAPGSFIKVQRLHSTCTPSQLRRTTLLSGFPFARYDRSLFAAEADPPGGAPLVLAAAASSRSARPAASASGCAGPPEELVAGCAGANAC